MSHVENVLRIPADVNRLAEVREFIRRHATYSGADPDATNDLVLAVDELATNSILHGYKGADGLVEVEVGTEDGSMIVRLRDQAPPFNPTTMPSPNTTLPLERRRKGGLGVHLSREASDQFSYRRTGQWQRADDRQTAIERRGRLKRVEHHRH